MVLTQKTNMGIQDSSPLVIKCAELDKDLHGIYIYPEDIGNCEINKRKNKYKYSSRKDMWCNEGQRNVMKGL